MLLQLFGGLECKYFARRKSYVIHIKYTLNYVYKYMKRFLKVKINYDDAVVTVQPVGIAELPKVFVQVAVDFLTNVPATLAPTS